MKYFRVDTLGDLKNKDLCVLHGNPSPLGTEYVRLIDGHPTAGLDASVVTMEMSEEVPGIELPTFIGNTSRFLMAASDAVEIVRRHDGANTEYMPFQVLDHRGRVAGSDHSFVNPLTVLDALHRGESDLMFFKDTDRIIKVKKIVLDGAPLEDAPGLFRIEHDRRSYVMSEALVDDLRAADATNLVTEELAVA